jgi:hypothetical protein
MVLVRVLMMLTHLQMNVVMGDLKQGKREVIMFLIGIHVESWGRNHGMLLILDK